MACSPAPTDRSIVLVGLMGAGKSTVGKSLARRLRRPFFDTDAEVERGAGLTVAEIFERFGEGHFRDSERRVVARLVGGPPKVIATGGGAFVDPQTRELILDQCLAVWLEADIETLADRVGRSRHRPLLRGGDPHVVLAALAAERNPIYAQAHLVVRSTPAPHCEAVDTILAALAEQGP
ncbi:MAG TPA: shikimate kinase [Allosphingosinicella sp.]|nr:shikimate kinase [Allosphingosinicella sp.]